MGHRPAFDTPTTLEIAHALKLSHLGDTFAIHSIGVRLSRNDLLLPLVSSARGPLTTRLTLLVSAEEITEPFGLGTPTDLDLTTVLPALDTAREDLQAILCTEALGWRNCLFHAGLLEDEGQEPIVAGETRILLSPASGKLTHPSNAHAVPEGVHHITSASLGWSGQPTVTDAEVLPTLVERSQSQDLLATVGLAAFIRRNPELLPALHEDTVRQLSYEFPTVMDALTCA